MALVEQRVVDGNILRLLRQYLKAGVLEDCKGWQPTEPGTPQGAVISPPMVNLHLNPLDHLVAGQGWELVRYADDFVALCRRPAEAETVLAFLRQSTTAAGLTLHPTKIRIVNARNEGFDLPGWIFCDGKKGPRRAAQEKPAEVTRQAPTADPAHQRALSPSHRRQNQSDAARLAGLLWPQSSHRFAGAGWLAAPPPAGHAAQTPKATRLRIEPQRQSTMAEPLVCRAEAVQSGTRLRHPWLVSTRPH